MHGKRNVNKEYTRRRDKVMNDACLYVRCMKIVCANVYESESKRKRNNEQNKRAQEREKDISNV